MVGRKFSKISADVVPQNVQWSWVVYLWGGNCYFNIISMSFPRSTGCLVCSIPSNINISILPLPRLMSQLKFPIECSKTLLNVSHPFPSNYLSHKDERALSGNLLSRKFMFPPLNVSHCSPCYFSISFLRVDHLIFIDFSLNKSPEPWMKGRWIRETDSIRALLYMSRKESTLNLTSKEEKTARSSSVVNHSACSSGVQWGVLWPSGCTSVYLFSSSVPIRVSTVAIRTEAANEFKLCSVM